jgi:excisionase family DNA binding protein
MDKMIMTVNQAVEVSGLSRHKILELIKTDPKFPYFMVGSHYRINRDMLKDYLTKTE